jgi:hypothetical protein
MAKKSNPGTRQTDGKNLVWFGETERKYAKLLMPIPFLTVLSLNYFMFKMLGLEIYLIVHSKGEDSKTKDKSTFSIYKKI